ncbi:MAG: guanylate kinase [Thermaerobacter sp.]|nr:guanylate kinase [Thermaerobacter sp.]
MPKRGHLFLLIGPSGSGKTTLIHAVRERTPLVRFIPTTTTRAPRPSEENGREYFFVSAQEFDQLIQRGDLLEWQWVHGQRYGTSRRRFADAIAQGLLGITSIDVLGGVAVKAAFPLDSTSIFVRPSSLEELQRRLAARGDTAGEDIHRRLARAEMEIDQATACDEVLINDDGRLQEAADRLMHIMDPWLQQVQER